MCFYLSVYAAYIWSSSLTADLGFCYICFDMLFMLQLTEEARCCRGVVAPERNRIF